MAVKDASIRVNPVKPLKPVKPVIKIKNYVRRHTSPVELTTLQGKGFKKLNLITLSKINKLIALAVESTFEKFRNCLSEVDTQRIEEEVQKELRRRIREQSRPDSASADAPVAGGPGAPASGQAEPPKPSLYSGLTVGRRESSAENEPVGSIAPPRLRIQPARGAARDSDSTGPRPDAGAGGSDRLEELERAVRELVVRVLEEEFDRLRPTEDIGRESRALDFKVELDRIIATIVDPEARRLPEIVNQISNQRTDLLERRLEKLKSELLEMEVAMERLAAQKSNSGLASIFREVQGLNQLDEGYMKKKGLLQSIFESNLELQGRRPRGAVEPGRGHRRETGPGKGT